MARTKRKLEVVDLTNDSDEENNYSSGKAQRQQKKNGSQATYTTPPSSSQPLRSSQGRVSSQHDSTKTAPPLPTPSSSQTHRQEERDAWSSTQEASFMNDAQRSINLTLDDEDNDWADRQLYGILDTKIVGIQYYRGRANPEEYVIVKREPRNPYDRNAIRIDNVAHQQIGHIPRGIAAKLASFIDSKQLFVEGRLTGPKGSFDCPIGLSLYGTNDPSKSQHLKDRMNAAKLPVKQFNEAERERKRRQKEFEKQQKAREKVAKSMSKNGNVVFDMEGPNKYSHLQAFGDVQNDSQQDLEGLLGGTAMYNPREVQDAVNKFGHGEEKLESMQMAVQPEQLATKLLPYQLQGLHWMLQHESPGLPEKNSGETVQLWKNSQGIYTNIATSFSVTQAPQLASGGILADDMGLGKTIQIISLILADTKKSGQPTLIIAPLSVLSNWKQQVEMHTRKKYAPNVLIYHGQETKGMMLQELKKYDIIVTTYQTTTLELFPQGKDVPGTVPSPKGLFSLTWRRVVLDEGHNIRNPKAKMARAVCSLQADSRWVLTGTPIVNGLKDLYSHVKFLRLSGGLAEFDIFNGTLIRPLKNGDPSARILLQALMQTLCLRRMKDMKFIDLKLPELTFHKMPVTFLRHEQERYDAFKAEAKGLMEAVKAKKGDNNMTHLLEVLLRLRQTCNHWKMCGEDRVKRLLSLVEEGGTVDIVNPANRKALQDLLQLKLDTQEDCPVCMESINGRSPLITPCAHSFCRSCIEKVIETQAKCPMCRNALSSIDTLVEPAANFGEAEPDIDISDSSSKVEAIVKVLKASDRNKNTTKTVVFSQWTSFLDILQTQLIKHGLRFARLDGRMNALKRDTAIEALSTDPDCKIMLASLSVCSVGLNLVAANQIILSDSWWAPAIEDQAVDRVYRLGQKSDCRVLRFVVEGTIEDEVLEIQGRKRKLAGMAFGEKGKQRGREGTLGDIERLLR